MHALLTNFPTSHRQTKHHVTSLHSREMQKIYFVSLLYVPLKMH